MLSSTRLRALEGYNTYKNDQLDLHCINWEVLKETLLARDDLALICPLMEIIFSPPGKYKVCRY